MFVFSFLVVVHLVACLWVMAARLNDEPESTWMGDGYLELSSYEQYLTSFYFTITTITTVGYGDINIDTVVEKIMCIFLMLTGVLAFSFASGSLASIL